MAVTDILITPATIYYAAVGTTLPDESTVDYAEAWPSPWVNLGYTLEPVSMAYETEVFELEVQQLTNPVKRVRTKETITIETVLAEFTGANLALVTDGTTTPTAAGSGQVAWDLIKAGGSVDLSEYAWGFEGFRLTAANVRLPVRIFLLRGTATMNGDLAFAKNAGVGIPIQVMGLADTAQTAGEQLIQIHNVTAVATT